MKIEDVPFELVKLYNLDLSNSAVETKMAYLKQMLKNIPESALSEIVIRVISSFTPTAANPFPWIPEFKAALVPAGGSERDANAAYALLERRSHIYKDAVVEDAAVQAGLDSIGGWQEFCQREIDQNPWLRKAFVKAFMQAREAGYQREPKVYRGIADRCEPVIIGNVERCRLAYQSYRMPQEQIESATHRAIAGAIAHLPAVEA